jgi:hypothetical protein
MEAIPLKRVSANHSRNGTAWSVRGDCRTSDRNRCANRLARANDSHRSIPSPSSGQTWANRVRTKRKIAKIGFKVFFVSDARFHGLKQRDYSATRADVEDRDADGRASHSTRLYRFSCGEVSEVHDDKRRTNMQRRTGEVKSHRKHLSYLLLALFLLPILALFIWYGRQVRQQMLDHSLIEAIKREDTLGAVAVLNQGADANAIDKPYLPMTLKSTLMDFWNRMKGNQPEKDGNAHPPALLLHYLNILDVNPTPNQNINGFQALPNGVGIGEFYDLPDNPELVKALLEHGANPDATDEEGYSILHFATKFHHPATVKVLLEHCINPNVRNKEGMTPLYFAKSDCARQLLEAGADVDARDKRERTPFMWTDSLDTYQLLLDYHAYLNAQDINGYTELIRCILSYSDGSDNVVHFLLKHGAKVSIKDKRGETALDYARNINCKELAISERQKKALILLLDMALKKEKTEPKSST